jgi:hypothetical protein
MYREIMPSHSLENSQELYHELKVLDREFGTQFPLDPRSIDRFSKRLANRVLHSRP